MFFHKIAEVYSCFTTIEKLPYAPKLPFLPAEKNGGSSRVSANPRYLPQSPPIEVDGMGRNWIVTFMTHPGLNSVHFFGESLNHLTIFKSLNQRICLYELQNGIWFTVHTSVNLEALRKNEKS